MMIDIDASKNFMVTHAKACYPNECCGLIARKGNKQEVICGRNISDHPRHHFVLHPHDYVAAESAGEILAIYHSHCEESPTASDADRTVAEKHGLPIITVGLTRKIGVTSVPVTRNAAPVRPATSFLATSESQDTGSDFEEPQWGIYKPIGWKHPLEGRPFVYGVLDCFTLLQDTYEKELNIKLPDLTYGGDWWNHTDIFGENLESFGFVRVRSPIKYDLIVMKLDGKYPNHVSIYWGDGMMLHHGPGHLSGMHPYICEHGYYARCTTGFYRHKATMADLNTKSN